MCDATKFLLLTAIVLTLLVPGLAQQGPNLPLGTRSVLVNVLDAHGVVRDLTKEEFRVSVNGRRIQVRDARYSLAPRRIVVLLDMSGSMTEAESKKWQIAQHAMDDVLTETPRDVSIALLAFAGKVRDVFDFSQNRTAIDRWLKEGSGKKPELKPAGQKTGLFDAILHGLTLLNPVHNGDAIYAITDGVDNASGASAERTKAALLQSGVRLFVFLLAEPEPIEELQEKKNSFLSMADETGDYVFGLAGRHKPFGTSTGAYFVYDRTNSEMITAETRELNILVNGFWTLDLELSGLSKKNKMKLELVGGKEKPRADLTLIYARELFAPK